MRDVSISVGVDRKNRIDLGRRGENRATQIVFDVSCLAETFGAGTAQLAAVLPGETVPYPVAATQDDGAKTVTWTVTNADTAKCGFGACQLFWYVGDALAKSIVFATVVEPDIGDAGEEPPEAYETWVEQVLAAGTAAEAAAASGLTTEAKTALLNCIAHIGAWDNGNGQTYYDALYDALMNTDWSITNTLTHCTTSNSAAAVTKNAAYSATITAAAGYTLTGATVSITMGGTDITSTAYSNGVISIASVTGALVISVSAVESVAELVSISAAYTQSGTVHPDDPLSTLKSDLVVTALYDDSSTAAVAATDYTLSGTLTVGTSTVTVTYEGKTTTFSVTVTAPRVPSGYEEVEYIFNTNEMSFSTGVTLSGTGDVVIEASFLPYGDLANAYIVSTRNSSSANTVGMALAAYNSDTINFYAGTSVGIQPTTLDKVKHEVTATITSTGASITDGTLSASDTFTPRVHNVVPLYLFGMLKTDNSVGYPFYGRIYYLKVTENNVDKLELIPCVRLSDGMAGFYDTVSEAFLYDNYFAAAPSAHNTTAEIANPWSVNAFADGVLTPTQSAQCGTTKKYDIPETTSLYPAGILPTETPGSGSRPKYLQSGNVVVFNGETLINHVNEYTSVRRWAKEASGTLTEYKKEWTVDPYNKISFDVDLRYLHDSYMYDYTTGLVFFAGRNTPYYGMRNVSEASA